MELKSGPSAPPTDLSPQFADTQFTSKKFFSFIFYKILRVVYGIFTVYLHIIKRLISIKD